MSYRHLSIGPHRIVHEPPVPMVCAQTIKRLFHRECPTDESETFFNINFLHPKRESPRWNEHEHNEADCICNNVYVIVNDTMK